MTKAPQGRDMAVRTAVSGRFEDSFDDIRYKVEVFLRRFTCRIDVDNVVGEVMECLLKNWDQVDDPTAWAIKVASNKATDQLRKVQATPIDEVKDADAKQVSTLGVADNHLAQANLDQILRTLPPRQYKALTLLMLGFSNKEIRKIMNWSSTTVDRYICDGRKALKKILEQRD